MLNEKRPMIKSNIDVNYLFIVLFSGLFFLPFLGGVHLFDWDEINFAECSREMLLTREYLHPQIDFQPFREKPALFMWCQTLSMHVFGVNEFAARLPNAICGIITLLAVYHIGKNLYNKTFGLLWVLAYIGSILPHLYFRSGIIDPFFNLFIFLSLIFLIKTDDSTRPQSNLPRDFSTQYGTFILGGVFLGLAILTKGPVAYLIISLTWFFKVLIFKELNREKIKDYALFSLTAFLVIFLWVGVEVLKNGTWFIKTFMDYNIRLATTEDAGHGGFTGYHFVVIFFGCFPASIFALRALYKRTNFMDEKVDFTRWMKALFWVVIIVFSLVQSKIVHYSSMCYLPLTFLSAITLKHLIDKGSVLNYIKKLILIIGIFIGILIAILPFIGQNIELLKPLFQRDIFALKNLDAAVTWTGWESLVGFFFIGMVIIASITFKKGKILRGSFYLFISTALFVNLVLIFYINKIEGYSQNAAIEFYKNIAQEDCYIETFGFISYAHLFYAQKQKPANNLDKETLKRGSVDKPTYWVVKYSSKDRLDTVPTLQYLYDKNGFVFYKRK